MNVAVLGASPKPERYSHRAVAMLREKGHAVFPVNPGFPEILGLRAYPKLQDVPSPLDTVTVYVSPAVSGGMAEALLAARPRRVIFNPGAENPALAAVLRAAGIVVEEACTLVLLSTGQF